MADVKQYPEGKELVIGYELLDDDGAGVDVDELVLVLPSPDRETVTKSLAAGEVQREAAGTYEYRGTLPPGRYEEGEWQADGGVSDTQAVEPFHVVPRQPPPS